MVDWERVWLRTFTPFTQWIALAVNVFWLLAMLGSLAGIMAVIIMKRPIDRLDDLYRKGIQNVPFAGCYYKWNGSFNATACHTMNDGPNTMMKRLRPMYPKADKGSQKKQDQSSYWCTVDLMIGEQPCGSFNSKDVMMPEPKLESVPECYGVHTRMTHFQRDHIVKALTANLTQALGRILHVSQFYVECPLCRVSSDKGTWGSTNSSTKCYRNVITFQDGWPNNYRQCQHSTPDGCNGDDDEIDWKITPH